MFPPTVSPWDLPVSICQPRPACIQGHAPMSSWAERHARPSTCKAHRKATNGKGLSLNWAYLKWSKWKCVLSWWKYVKMMINRDKPSDLGVPWYTHNVVNTEAKAGLWSMAIEARIPLLFEDGGFARVEVVQKKRKEIRLASAGSMMVHGSQNGTSLLSENCVILYRIHLYALNRKILKWCFEPLEILKLGFKSQLPTNKSLNNSTNVFVSSLVKWFFQPHLSCSNVWLRSWIGDHPWGVWHCTPQDLESSSTMFHSDHQVVKVLGPKNLQWWLPSGNLLHSYWKLLFIVDLPIKNGDFP